MTELSEVFWTFLITSTCGIVLLAVRACYKSKCKEINCCSGLITIQRDTEGEEKLDAIFPRRAGGDENI
jgi:hypothetical protein